MNALSTKPLPSQGLDRFLDALNQRLQREHLIFEVDGLLYAVALANFDSVAPAEFTAESVPALPAWFGCLEDAGGLVPVLSLHQILSATLDWENTTTAFDRRLILFRNENLRCALYAHRCLGVFPIESAAQLPLAHSPLLRAEDSGCRSVIKWNNTLIVALVPSALVSPALAAQLRQHLSLTAKQRKKAAPEKANPEATPGISNLAWQGDLAGCTLAQVMQVLCLKKLTGELALECEGRTTFLYWADGDLIHARNGGGRAPEKIAAEASKLRHGRFQFHPRPVTAISRTIQGGTLNFIRDAARVLSTTTTRNS